MAKSALKVLAVAICLIFMPMVLMAIISVIGFVGPMVGLLLILFFPIILIGVIIGYRNGRNRKSKEQPLIEEK